MDKRLFTFHKTVQGYRHLQEGSICQDSSTSCIGDNNSYQIISIADGHGDPACHRSNRGARFAVDAAEDCMTHFAKAILTGGISFDYPRQRSACIQQLTNTIISKWCSAVRSDLLADEITEDDIKDAGRYKEIYRRGEQLEHLYGTTLIAALLVKNYLILIHQGDGRCDVLYFDGSADQPIPWDERCQGTTTTSMCDKDVFRRIRSTVIDLNKKNVAACFIGSDGVEDSYYDNEQTQRGTHRFYMDLVCKLHKYGVNNFESYLDDTLPAFSKNGSKDDVSVAGIVDLRKTFKLINTYQSRVTNYDHCETLRIGLVEAKSKVISMYRKHEILSNRIEGVKQEIMHVGWNQCRTVDLKEKLEKAKSEFDEYDRKYKFYKEEAARIEQEIILLEVESESTGKKATFSHHRWRRKRKNWKPRIRKR